MPTLSRWCVRAALVYLLVGMGMGSWMLLSQAVRGTTPGYPWGVLHAHLLLVGFLLFMIIGVAFWMFPRVQGQRPGRTSGWIAFWCINIGLILRAVAEGPSRGTDAEMVWRLIAGTAAVLPTLGVIAFIIGILPRVKAAMSPQEARRLREEHAKRQMKGPATDA